MKTKASHLGAIAGAGIILTLPVLILGIPFLSDDASFHTVWYTHFSDQLWSGDLYPRWLMGMNGGLGSPAFFFYPPVPYFLTSILKPFFRNDPMGWHQLGVSASVALIGSGLFAYLWLRNLVDENSALAAAILYMAMPYHLAADLYVRSSFAEYWAFVWMPLILYFIHRLATGHKPALVGVAIGWALLVMTHLPTTLTFSIIPFGYAIVVAPRDRKLKVLGLTLAATILGVGLSAIYLVPAMTTQQLVLMNQMATGYFSYANWLFPAKLSLWTEDKMTILLLVADVFLIATCAFVINRSSRDPQFKKMSSFWYAVAIAGVLMMTELSKPVWWLIPPIRRVQFPWRFNAVLALATTGLLALAIAAVKKNRSGLLSAAKIFALLLIMGWIPATVWKAWYTFPQNNPAQRDLSIPDREEEVKQSRDPPEYRPRWTTSTASIDWEASVDEDRWVALMKNDIESLLQRAGSSPEHPPEPIITEGTGRAVIAARKPREIDLNVESATGVQLNVPQFYYPYWTAHISGEEAELTITPSQPDGLISLSVPPGKHEVRLRLERSRPELVGQFISLASLAVALSLALYLGYFRRRFRGSD